MKRNKIKEEKIKKNTIRISTIIILIFICVIILFIGKGIISLFNKDRSSGNNIKQEITSKDLTKRGQEKFEVTNVNISGDGKLTNVTASVKNLDKKLYKYININVIFYDSKNNQVATAKGLIENLGENEQKNFSSYITGDYTNNLSYEVKVGEVQN